MDLKILIQLYERDLDRLVKELESFEKEENIWLTESQISNSAGNLTLHLIGNLKHFIGKEVGGFDYTRNRDFEFSGRDVPRIDLLQEIKSCRDQVIVSLEGMNDNLLAETYPLEVFGYKMTYCYFLMHLYGHLNYHLGQINYHRRLLDN